MVNKIRRAVQMLFLGGFIFLLFKGRIHAWMVVFLAGLFLSAVAGRFYCGWICPINTVTELVDKLYRKFKIKRMNIPSFLKNPVTRYILLAVFVLLFIFMRVTGKNLPVLPALFAVGIFLSLLFVPALWHRFLCPYGTILGLPAALARFSFRVDKEKCVPCGACERVCPGDAFTKEQEGFPEIKKSLCLECLSCSTVCPQGAIRYKSTFR